jgi:hypothetical protein
LRYNFVFPLAQQQPDSLVVILSPQFVIHHIDVEVQLPRILRFEWGRFQFHYDVCVQGDGIQNQVCIEIAVTNLKVFLSGNKGKAIAHFQQVTGDVLNQLFFYVPFVRLFLRSSQIKDVRVFQQVIGKVALRCRKRGCEIVYLVVADLSAI